MSNLPSGFYFFYRLEEGQNQEEQTRKTNTDTRAFELVFNVKVKLLHDSTLYQTSRRRLLVLPPSQMQLV